MESNRRFAHRDKPSVKQIYALCAAMCERQGEAFPETSVEASDLIERVRLQNGHPFPDLREKEVMPLRRPDRLR
jgi:hypothetical protein